MSENDEIKHSFERAILEIKVERLRKENQLLREENRKLRAAAPPVAANWHKFLPGLHGKPEFCKFCGEPEISHRHYSPPAASEAYPGQAFFHEHNPRIRRAEIAAARRKP